MLIPVPLAKPRSRFPLFAPAVALVTLVSVSPGRAQTFTEVGDAGQTPGTVQASGLTQATPVNGTVSILGNLSGANDADVFSLTFTNPTLVSFSTVNTLTNTSGGFAGGLDTQLFFFDNTGRPIFTNNDANGSTLQSRLPGGGAFTASLTAGTYLVGISFSDNNPVNTVNQLVFNSGADSTSVNGAAPGLNPANFSNFNSGNGFADAGNYRIDIQTVPEPSTWVFTALGLLAGGVAVSRRRQAAATQPVRLA